MRIGRRRWFSETLCRRNGGIDHVFGRILVLKIKFLDSNSKNFIAGQNKFSLEMKELLGNIPFFYLVVGSF